MKILNFGSCNVDHVYTVDHIVAPGETIKTINSSVFAGGKGLNQSIALAKAGAEVYHAGCIGTDGQFLADVLKDVGADVSFLKTVDEGNSRAIIQVTREGENAIFLVPGSNYMVTEEQIDEVLKHFNKGDILLLQNELTLLYYMIEQGKKAGMRIFLNPSPFNSVITNLDLSLIDCLILNEIEASGITGCNDPESALAFFKKHYPDLQIMLTLGKKGCIYQDKKCKYYHPIFQVKAIDTTAAGDTFTGYFVTALTQGLEIPEALRIASCASAISVSRRGAAPSIPSMEEVMAQINLLPLNNNISKTDRLKEKLFRYIQENLQSASLEDFATLLGYSVTYTGNLIKNATGESFRSLLQEKRLVMAESLLKNMEYSVGEIIQMIGYENESFFRKKFKAKYGLNPLAFRKTHHQ